MLRDTITYLLDKAMIAKGYMDLKHLMKNKMKAKQVNDRTLFRILKAGENSEYGRKYDFSSIKTVEEFRSRVPVTTYEDYKPYIERMINNNEEDLLTSFPLIGYAKSSGTTGDPKFIPLTQNIADLYKRNTLTVMMAMADRYCRENLGRPLKPGRGVFICLDFDEKLPNGRSATNVPETTAKQLGFMYPYLLNVPLARLVKLQDISLYYLLMRFALEDRNTMYIFSVFFSVIYEVLAFMQRYWKELVDDIEKGIMSDNISRATPEIREELKDYLKPNPERAAELRREFEKGFDETILQRIWPNLSVIYGISGSVYDVYSEGVRKIAGDVPFDYSIYGASEGLIAAPYELNNEDRIPVTDSCFLEFMPEDDETITYTLDQLEPGQEYEMIITNQAGLYRYRIGDVVRCERYEDGCPIITFARRKGHLISICGEKTTEENLLSLVSDLEEASGAHVDNWIIYVNNDSRPSHYTMVLENSEGIDMSVYSDMADEYMCSINEIYRRFRDNLAIRPMNIANQAPGTHAAWKEHMIAKGTAPTQVKPVRVLDNEEKREFFVSRIL